MKNDRRDDGQAWGTDSRLIEEWFSAGDAIEAEGWATALANGWEEGTVLTRERVSGRADDLP